jgi:hypothetical protein
MKLNKFFSETMDALMVTTLEFLQHGVNSRPTALTDGALTRISVAHVALARDHG